MVLGFGAAKTEDVASLIAKKNYSKAIELIKVQIKGQKADPRLRMQLADVLIMAGKGREAAIVLEPLADEYAREGFAAKAISVLKKIQKADPSRRDVESKLASLIEAKQRQAVSHPGPPISSMPEIGIEEIGFEPPTSGSIAVPVEPARRTPEPEIAFAAEPEVGMEMELAPPEPPRVPPVPVAPPPSVAPAVTAAPVVKVARAAPVVPVAPEVLLVPAVAAEAPSPPARDFFLEEPEEGGLEFLEDEPAELLEPIVEVEAEPLADAEPLLEAEPDPMSDAAFADEVTSLLDDLFPASAVADDDGEAGSPSGAQIVVSPLFRDFSVDELVAVIQGLKLLTYLPKQIVLREGDRGESLFMLTSGTVKAFRKNAQGKQVALAELSEGAFFGEGSILTGKPRTATVVAWEECELLELDRPTLDSITKTHPRVWDVLQEFAAKRTAKS
jgi:Cyclic nucleotide-binding domain